MNKNNIIKTYITFTDTSKCRNDPTEIDEDKGRDYAPSDGTLDDNIKNPPAGPYDV